MSNFTLTINLMNDPFEDSPTGHMSVTLSGPNGERLGPPIMTFDEDGAELLESTSDLTVGLQLSPNIVFDDNPTFMDEVFNGPLGAFSDLDLYSGRIEHEPNRVLEAVESGSLIEKSFAISEEAGAAIQDFLFQNRVLGTRYLTPNAGDTIPIRWLGSCPPVNHQHLASITKYAKVCYSRDNSVTLNGKHLPDP